MVCSPPGARGTPGAEVGHGGYPCEPVSGPLDCQVNKNGKSAPPSCPSSFPSCGGQAGSLSFGSSPNDTLLCPHHHNVSGPKGGGGDNAGGISSHRSLWGHHCPLGTSPLLMMLKGTIHFLLYPSTCPSCQILQVSQLEGLWQNVHL